MLKICSKCDIEKSLSEFHRSGNGHCSKCKICRNELNRIYKSKNRGKVREYNKYYNGTYKAKEQKKKWVKENRDYHPRYYIDNIQELKEYRKEWYLDNREEIILKRREYYVLNIEEMKNKSMEYYHSVKHNGEFKKKKCKYMKKRRKDIPHIFAWRGILISSLRYLNTDKEFRTIEMLGYSANDLKLHMESLFIEGMTWDNWGEWHIDHKYPLSKFDKVTSPHIVNALSNLQPLWAIDNIKKGNKIDG